MLRERREKRVVQDKDRELWAAVEADYLAGEMSVRDIARKHGVSESRVYKKATSDGWKKKKQKIKQKNLEKLILISSFMEKAGLVVHLHFQKKKEHLNVTYQH